MTTQNSDDIIIITENPNVIKIEILQDKYSLVYFYNEITKKLSRKILDKLDMSSIFNINGINKKILYIIDNNDKVFNISIEIDKDGKVDYNKIFISQRKKKLNTIQEKVIKFLPNNNYSVIRKDPNYEDSSYKIYINDTQKLDEFFEDNKEDIDFSFRSSYILSKKNAFKDINQVLSNLEQVQEISSIIDIDRIYNYLGIISNNKYSPIIKDNSITLYQEKNVDNYHFYIVLNKTKEKIGELSFTSDSDILDDIHYIIYDNYKNKSIEARALRLVKKLLDDNKIMSSGKIGNKMNKVSKTNSFFTNSPITVINRPVQLAKRKKIHF